MFKFIRKSLLWLLMLPYVLSYTGEALNQLVLIANNGKFPVMETQAWMAAGNIVVDQDGMTGTIHCVMTKDTHLNFLADVINLHTAILSVGDVMQMGAEEMSTYCYFLWIVIMASRAARREEA